ncbi:flagellar assembly protein FliH [Pusillimonas sp.]|uniref:flagellar assembly protein FliH n=1 Tax=Pusillimonas sp. TaxID=3040095 RepID=UPI0037C91667
MSNPARQALRAYESEAWRRWEMDSVEPAKSVGQGEEGLDRQAIPLPTHVLEEIAQLKKQAKEAGRAEGHAAGYKEGHQQGLAEGRAQGVEEGRAEGREAGLKQTLDEGRVQNETEAQRLAALLQNCAQALHEVEEETGQALIRLAISISQQVIRSTLTLEPERILETIHDILHLDGGQEGLLRLRLNPEDLALVQDHISDDPLARQWRLQADPAMERGGCVAETTLGSIDATLQTRWQRVVGALGHNIPWTSSS